MIPTDLGADLLCWLKADTLGLSNGDPLTGWNDDGTLNNDGVLSGTAPTYVTGSTPAGGPSVDFVNGRFTFPDMLTGKAAGEILAYIKSDGSNCGLWGFGARAGNSDESHYPFSGTVFENFGKSTNDRPSFTPSLPITSWRVYDVWSANNDWAALLDGVLQATDATNTVAWATAPVIGAGYKNNAIDLPFLGNGAEFIVVGRKLTTLERTDLTTYLTDRHVGMLVAAPPFSVALSMPPALMSISVAAPPFSVALSMPPAVPTLPDRPLGPWTADESRAAEFSLDVQLAVAAEVPDGPPGSQVTAVAETYPVPTLVDGRPT